MSRQTGSLPSTRNRVLESIRPIIEEALRNADEQVQMLQERGAQQEQRIRELQAEVSRLQAENSACKSAVYALTREQHVELTEEFLRDVKEHGIPFEQVVAELEKM
jgi:hypothetical protein